MLVIFIKKNRFTISFFNQDKCIKFSIYPTNTLGNLKGKKLIKRDNNKELKNQAFLFKVHVNQYILCIFTPNLAFINLRTIEKK